MNENGPHGLVQPGVQREAFAVVIQGKTHFAPLLADDFAELILPFPNLVHELLAAEIIAGNALFAQLSFNFGLCCNPGVVHPRQVQGVKALHPLLADNHVLERGIPGMTHVQLTRYVWWWNNDCVWFSFLVATWFKDPFVDPFLVAAGFDRFRIVFWCQF